MVLLCFMKIIMEKYIILDILLLIYVRNSIHTLRREIQ